MHISVDFITKLLIVTGKDAILVVCDRLSKMTYFVAIMEGTTAEGLARLFRDNVWKLHGLLKSMVSDRGPQFAAELTKELNRMLGIKTKLSTAFLSQIRYSLVVILELNGVSEVQYKDVMMVDDGKYQ